MAIDLSYDIGTFTKPHDLLFHIRGKIADAWLNYEAADLKNASWRAKQEAERREVYKYAAKLTELSEHTDTSEAMRGMLIYYGHFLTDLVKGRPIKGHYNQWVDLLTTFRVHLPDGYDYDSAPDILSKDEFAISWFLSEWLGDTNKKTSEAKRAHQARIEIFFDALQARSRGECMEKLTCGGLHALDNEEMQEFADRLDSVNSKELRSIA